MYVVGAKKRPRNENDTIWLEMEQFNFVSFLNEKSLEKCDFFTKLQTFSIKIARSHSFYYAKIRFYETRSENDSTPFYVTGSQRYLLTRHC